MCSASSASASSVGQACCLAYLGKDEIDVDPAGGQHSHRQQPERQLQRLLAPQDHSPDDGEEQS